MSNLGVFVQTFRIMGSCKKSLILGFCLFLKNKIRKLHFFHCSFRITVLWNCVFFKAQHHITHVIRHVLCFSENTTRTIKNGENQWLCASPSGRCALAWSLFHFVKARLLQQLDMRFTRLQLALPNSLRELLISADVMWNACFTFGLSPSSKKEFEFCFFIY